MPRQGGLSFWADLQAPFPLPWCYPVSSCCGFAQPVLIDIIVFPQLYGATPTFPALPRRWPPGVCADDCDVRTRHLGFRGLDRGDDWSVALHCAHARMHASSWRLSWGRCGGCFVSTIGRNRQLLLLWGSLFGVEPWPAPIPRRKTWYPNLPPP